MFRVVDVEHLYRQVGQQVIDSQVDPVHNVPNPSIDLRRHNRQTLATVHLTAGISFRNSKEHLSKSSQHYQILATLHPWSQDSTQGLLQYNLGKKAERLHDRTDPPPQYLAKDPAHPRGQAQLVGRLCRTLCRSRIECRLCNSNNRPLRSLLLPNQIDHLSRPSLLLLQSLAVLGTMARRRSTKWASGRHPKRTIALSCKFFRRLIILDLVTMISCIAGLFVAFCMQMLGDKSAQMIYPVFGTRIVCSWSVKDPSHSYLSVFSQNATKCIYF